jgi:hypothetical protein
MTGHPARLLARLDALAASLAATPGALALIGQGSTGADQHRLDAYSDLDFFVIVAPGCKAPFLADLSWLSRPAPLAYAFRNTPDGYKALYADGLFCEFAVFEPAELAAIHGGASRGLWQAPDFDLAPYQRPDQPPPPPRDVEWLVGEALTNLYIGLGRYHRGEKLSALRFVQGYAVDRLVELADQSPRGPDDRDPFVPERRFEQRHPALADQLPACLPGYDHTPAAARAILARLEQFAPLNPALRQAILDLSTPGP